MRLRKHPDVPLPEVHLEFFNGLGGFAENGREYVTRTQRGTADPRTLGQCDREYRFGFLVSESGSGFTWSLNSHENQLTPWSNDHVMDTPGEVIYVRDEVTGEVWTPTALCPFGTKKRSYMARHGQGYTRFLHGSHGILLDLVQFVAPDDPIKISRLTLQNNSPSTRRLSVTAYVEWVLGSSRSASAPYIITEIDRQSGAMFARNAWNNDFAGRIAFADMAGKQTSYTGDRTEFLGQQRYSRKSRSLGNRLARFRETSGRGLIRARRCRHLSSCAPAQAWNRVFHRPNRKSRRSTRIARPLSRCGS